MQTFITNDNFFIIETFWKQKIAKKRTVDYKFEYYPNEREKDVVQLCLCLTGWLVLRGVDEKRKTKQLRKHLMLNICISWSYKRRKCSIIFGIEWEQNIQNFLKIIKAPNWIWFNPINNNNCNFFVLPQKTNFESGFILCVCVCFEIHFTFSNSEQVPRMICFCFGKSVNT